jgi:hypothetical protein
MFIKTVLIVVSFVLISCKSSTEPIEYILENTTWELVKVFGIPTIEPVIVVAENGEEYTMKFESNVGTATDACTSCNFEYEKTSDNEITFSDLACSLINYTGPSYFSNMYGDFAYSIDSDTLILQSVNEEFYYTDFFYFTPKN